jgi:phage regulator Rha-like protein
VSADKSAKRREELGRQIEQVERQEDEFSEARQRHERSLEQFREQFHAAGRERESSLGERMQAGDTGAQR